MAKNTKSDKRNARGARGAKRSSVAAASGGGGGGRGNAEAVAADLYEQTAGALQTVLDFQDQWVRSWADYVEQSTRLIDRQQQWQKAALASVPAAQRSIQASVDMVERTSRAGIAWMQTALDFAAAPGAVWEAGTRAQELARRSVDVLQTGARAVADAHREAVDSWRGAMRNGGEVAKAAARSVEEVGRLSRATARKTARSSAEAARELTHTAAATAEQSTRAALRPEKKAA